MRNLWVGLVMGFCAAMILLEPGGAQKEKPAPPPKEHKENKERKLKSSELKKFSKPAPAPHTHRPPDRRGGSWHWHQHHGWVWLRIGIAPPVIVLPLGFALPDEVILWEPEPILIMPVPRWVTGRCPHCWRLLRVQVD